MADEAGLSFLARLLNAEDAPQLLGLADRIACMSPSRGAPLVDFARRKLASVISDGVVRTSHCEQALRPNRNAECVEQHHVVGVRARVRLPGQHRWASDRVHRIS